MLIVMEIIFFSDTSIADFFYNNTNKEVAEKTPKMAPLTAANS
jgi:hypothetical protein